MDDRHKEVHRRNRAGESFAELGLAFNVSRARAQQLFKEQSYHLAMMAKYPVARTLRYSSPSGRTVAGWLVKFLEGRGLTVEEVARRGATWLRAVPRVGVGKVESLAWAMAAHGVIDNADQWVSAT